MNSCTWLTATTLVATTLLPLAVNAAPKDYEPLKIVLVGDSTVCNYPKKSPNRGWGQFIEEDFKTGTAKVLNFAAEGRSTKTFISEGRWQSALKRKPDYILIQFGHNDSHTPDKPESTDAATDYKAFLRRYIDDSRAIGATPILVTPMVRRTFNQWGTLTDNLQPYATAMLQVGKEKQTPVIDLHTSSRILVEKLGPLQSITLANRIGDNTHFNEKGARTMAALVMNELPILEPELRNYLKTPEPPSL